ncbi:MAG TPA: polysaccharide deacetylase family protein [Gemmatimonadales bacterium]|jgi:peptidoglycan/xylan/chitin deacetylase (PgdA/CDA1 family)|nr:polysaccharide deacetylase family protein [Gemmatimonadales bacterium]
MLASLCYSALQFAGLPALARRLRDGGVVLCYHNVVAATDVSPWTRLGLHMALPAFERQMRWLAAHYELIGLEQFVDRLARPGSLRGTAAVTFDDAYAGVFDHAWPLLQALGIPATVFVVAEAPERADDFWWDRPDVLQLYSRRRREHWLTTLQGDGARIVRSLTSGRGSDRPPLCCRPAVWQPITEAARSGLGIGAHSATHRSLPTLDDRDLRREVSECGDLIRRRTGVAPAFFAYPYGRWNDRVRQAVRAAGYRAAFTLDYGHNAAGADPWVLRRVNVPAGIGDVAFQAWTAGLSLRPPRAA